MQSPITGSFQYTYLQEVFVHLKNFPLLRLQTQLGRFKEPQGGAFEAEKMGIIDGFPQLHRPLIGLLHGCGTRWKHAQRGREAEVDESLHFLGLNQAIQN